MNSLLLTLPGSVGEILRCSQRIKPGRASPDLNRSHPTIPTANLDLTWTQYSCYEQVPCLATLELTLSVVEMFVNNTTVELCSLWVNCTSNPPITGYSLIYHRGPRYYCTQHLFSFPFRQSGTSFHLRLDPTQNIPFIRHQHSPRSSAVKSSEKNVL